MHVTLRLRAANNIYFYLLTKILFARQTGFAQLSSIQTEQEKHWKVGKFGAVVNPRKYKAGGNTFVATPPPPPPTSQVFLSFFLDNKAPATHVFF